MMESITFDTDNQRIIVVDNDGNEKIYHRQDASNYVEDFNRIDDIRAMNWNLEK